MRSSTGALILHSKSCCEFGGQPTHTLRYSRSNIHAPSKASQSWKREGRFGSVKESGGGLYLCQGDMGDLVLVICKRSLGQWPPCLKAASEFS